MKKGKKKPNPNDPKYVNNSWDIIIAYIVGILFIIGIFLATYYSFGVIGFIILAGLIIIIALILIYWSKVSSKFENVTNVQVPWKPILSIVGIIAVVILLLNWPFDWPNQSEPQRVTVETPSPVVVETPNNCETCYSEKQDNQLRIGNDMFFEKGKKYWFYRGCSTRVKITRSSKPGVIMSYTMLGGETTNHIAYKIDTNGGVLETVKKTDNLDYGNYYLMVDQDVVFDVVGTLEN